MPRQIIDPDLEVVDEILDENIGVGSPAPFDPFKPYSDEEIAERTRQFSSSNLPTYSDKEIDSFMRSLQESNPEIMEKLRGSISPAGDYLEDVHIEDQEAAVKAELEKQTPDADPINLDDDSYTTAKVNDLINHFQKEGISYTKYDPEGFQHKNAYPNNEGYLHVPGQHNTDKWLQTVKDIYHQEKNNIDRRAAIINSTEGWAPKEQFDFLNWLKFYEGGNHLKYKFAQSWYIGRDESYLLPIKVDNSNLEKEINNAKDSSVTELSGSEKKKIIENQRKKIIGRLDSVEKLLRTEQGHLFAGNELESLMETIFNLKKKVNVVNKLSASTRLYEDMIIREANILVKKGFEDSAELLFTLAEEAAKEDNKGAMPPPAPPAPPAQGSGSAGGLPATNTKAQPNAPEAPKNNAPGSAGSPAPGGPPSLPPIPGVKDLPPPPPPPPAPSPTPPASTPGSQPTPPTPAKDPKPAGIKNFLSRLDETDDNSLEVSEDDVLLSYAQEVAPPPPAASEPPPATPMAPAPPAVVEPPVTEELEVVDSPITPKSDFDNKVNQVLSSIRVEDVVSKLEDLAKVFRTREIPRQLAIIDMMLDSLGLASYFPSLSEATNKALESNNYISTRIDDILSKLHGAVKKNKIDLAGDEPKVSPQVEAIQDNLQEAQDLEKARKDLRKQQETEELMATEKETPEIEIEEEPAAPVAPAPPTPVASPATPPTAATGR